ncbi:MAG: hypothetical protein OXC92_01590 [Flavobacteriaceae bacterium]|nr:hypothetical protein [Flavobacteriaceae bacterium]MCY4254023.1 hypothetical protein [Flavobacteriaceae bacterium]
MTPIGVGFIIIVLIVIIGIYHNTKLSRQNTDDVKSSQVYEWNNQTGKLSDEVKSSQTESETLEQLKAIRRNTNITATIIVVFTILWTLGAIIFIFS